MDHATAGSKLRRAARHDGCTFPCLSREKFQRLLWQFECFHDIRGYRSQCCPITILYVRDIKHVRKQKIDVGQCIHRQRHHILELTPQQALWYRRKTTKSKRDGSLPIQKQDNLKELFIIGAEALQSVSTEKKIHKQ